MKALIVYNPYSGKQKFDKMIDYIKKEVEKKYDDVSIYKSEGEKSIREHLKNEASNYDYILISGGDGTMNEAINGILASGASPLLGYIPSGTVNDLGSLLHLKKNIKKGLKIALNGSEVFMDVGRVNNYYFIYALGAGKYTDVSYKAKRRSKHFFGKIAYFIYGMKEFFKIEKMELEIDINNEKIKSSYYVLLCLNTKRIAGFRLYRKNKVLLNDGKMDLTLIEKNEKWLTWPRLAFFFLFGDLHKLGVKTLSLDSFTVKSKNSIPINTDGELAMIDNEFKIDVIKERIRILVPLKIKKKYFK